MNISRDLNLITFSIPKHPTLRRRRIKFFKNHYTFHEKLQLKHFPTFGFDNWPKDTFVHSRMFGFGFLWKMQLWSVSAKVLCLGPRLYLLDIMIIVMTFQWNNLATCVIFWYLKCHGKLYIHLPKLYIPSTLNIGLILWHTQLIVCAVKY